ncbi:MAG TPA: ABC transporter permease [Inquilinus sp.]|nr:ABC transporter permease [Inquilinus sp.]
MTELSVPRPSLSRPRPIWWAPFTRASTWRGLLPFLSLAVILASIFLINPRTMSYVGLNLMLGLAIPIMFATLAQMCMLTVNDLDLGIGAYVGFVTCVAATWLVDQPWLGIAVLLGGVLAYAAAGALIHLRRVPSLVVTLGMSFVWLGLAILVLPSPGGSSPAWLRAAMTWKPPLVPLPILVAVVLAVVVHLFLMRSALGAVLRGAGGNPKAITRAGWSLLRIRIGLYALAGVFGLLAGLSLLGLSTSGDSNIAQRYTLLSIAGAVLGGCDFVGGRVSPIGAVTGALVLALAASLLTFLNISPDWQIGAQGAILIIVLALRALTSRRRAR